MSDNEYEKAHQSGSHTYPRAAGDCKKGDYIILNDHPCKVVETSTSKTGKHGHAKSKITAIDIFTGVKVEDVLPSSHNVDCPFVTKTEYELVSIDANDFVTFLTEEGEYREDLKLPKEDDNDFIPQLRADYDKGLNLVLTVTAAMGYEQIIGYRENKK